MKKLSLHHLCMLMCLLGVALAGSLFLIRRNSPASPDETVHYHAGFQVYVDGVKQDFSDTKYMLITPCSANPTKPVAEDPQLEKAHLHDGIGDVVHVEHSGATWGDLFQNMHYTFEANKSVVGYVDNQSINNILSTPIQSNQSVVIVVGNQENAQEYLKNKVSQEHIAQVEKKSESCGKQQ